MNNQIILKIVINNPIYKILSDWVKKRMKWIKFHESSQMENIVPRPELYQLHSKFKDVFLLEGWADDCGIFFQLFYA